MKTNPLTNEDRLQQELSRIQFAQATERHTLMRQHLAQIVAYCRRSNSHRDAGITTAEKMRSALQLELTTQEFHVNIMAATTHDEIIAACCWYQEMIQHIEAGWIEAEIVQDGRGGWVEARIH